MPERNTKETPKKTAAPQQPVKQIRHFNIEKTHPEVIPYAADIDLRMTQYEKKLARLLTNCSSLNEFANAHEYYGFHRLTDCWVYREWAPGADQLFLAGDFNSWSWSASPLTKLENGNWELRLPKETLHKGSKVITIVKNGEKLTQHLPLYTKRAVQDTTTWSWCCEVWDDPVPYAWTDAGFSCSEPPLIYEAHVGMSGEEHRVAQYREFADKVLPHIRESGYNTIQLMGIMEHPYYGSFGYQVSNFYAAASRYGLPEDLKYLINKAHGMGLRVLLDVVHSHAVGNTLEGINLFDGTVEQFFHKGARGDHPAWGTKLFNYDRDEVLHFLLSNLKFWLTEYHFDGFRFDGVTSMLYRNHGLGESFDMSKYFTLNTDVESVTYLQLANKLIREVKPDAITIAEDMSGMPGMCEPIADGGIGFDYRLGMGVPDMWIRLIKTQSDENWNLGKIWGEMTARNAPTIAYAESHDQALVGDQTIMFRLAGAAMYDQMETKTHTLVIDRATALHKMIRLLTLASGGNGYLNFMGNEFGHPEWIDFPTPANGYSYQYCRRQWSLLENKNLKYHLLYAFDRDMIALVKKYRVLEQNMPDLRLIHEDDHILAFERGGLLFVFNLNPSKAFNSYAIPVSQGKDYEVILSSDDLCYGGYGRVYHDRHSAFAPGRSDSRVQLYLPPRVCMVLTPVEPAPAAKAVEAADPLPAEKAVKRVHVRKIVK